MGETQATQELVELVELEGETTAVSETPGFVLTVVFRVAPDRNDTAGAPVAAVVPEVVPAAVLLVVRGETPAGVPAVPVGLVALPETVTAVVAVAAVPVV